MTVVFLAGSILSMTFKSAEVAEMLEEKFGIKASVNLAARVVKRWKQSRADAEK